MIIVIANTEKNQKTGRDQIIVSHGIDSDTGRNVILPQETPERLGAVFDPSLGEYILPSQR